MGYSTTLAASVTMRRLSEACIKSTGSQNVMQVGNRVYMFERSDREHDDGSITGTVAVFKDQMHPSGFLQKYDRASKAVRFADACGHFRINPDGTLKRGPKWMKEALA